MRMISGLGEEEIGADHEVRSVNRTVISANLKGRETIGLLVKWLSKAKVRIQMETTYMLKHLHNAKICGIRKSTRFNPKPNRLPRLNNKYTKTPPTSSSLHTPGP